MRRAIIFTCISLLLSLLLLLAGASWFYQAAQQQNLQLQDELVLDVGAGATPLGLLHQLEQDGVIRGVFWLRLGWRFTGQKPGLHRGEYSLQPGMSLQQLLDKWRSGDIRQYRITLVEGWNFAQFRRALSQHPLLEQSIVALADTEIMQLLERDGLHPEGQFYPDTYQYHKGQSDLDILRQANRRLEEVLAQEWQQRASDLPYKEPYQALIMASIIEKETGVAHERAQIAGVFVRRLQRNMLLQTDPTVIYGMGDKYQGKITRNDLRRHTPYNTYTNAGLPPTPIAMVGRAAINAALQPADGTSLYFVARGDGTHQFSRTLDEHNKAVRKYQLQRRADYRSTVQPAAKQ